MGYLPPTELTVATTLMQKSSAERIAREQVRMGVHPAIAAWHGARVSEYRPLYFIFCFPMTLIYIGMPYGIGFPGAIAGFALGIRLMKWSDSRADVKINYQIPTWVLILFLYSYLINVGIIYVFVDLIFGSNAPN